MSITFDLEAVNRRLQIEIAIVLFTDIKGSLQSLCFHHRVHGIVKGTGELYLVMT